MLLRTFSNFLMISKQEVFLLHLRSLILFLIFIIIDSNYIFMYFINSVTFLPLRLLDAEFKANLYLSLRHFYKFPANFILPSHVTKCIQLWEYSQLPFFEVETIIFLHSLLRPHHQILQKFHHYLMLTKDFNCCFLNIKKLHLISFNPNFY